MVKHNRTYLILMVALLGATACSSVDDDAVLWQQKPAEEVAVDFGAYLQRATTRAGTTGTLDGTALQGAGFGVIAYYTDKVLYSTLAVPNFMYNQQVEYSSDHWEYAPLKSWPSTNDGGGYLSFFAYAPYVTVAPNTGLVTADGDTGIGALTATSIAGNPQVRYYVSLTPSQCVDLCWADPKVDQLRPDVDSRVMFSFQHALSSLNVKIKADVDGGDGNRDNNTRIWVRQVTFDGFDMSGQLNLASTDGIPIWTDVRGGMTLGSKPVTVHDGRRDGREGSLASSGETPAGLNPLLVQSAPYVTSPELTTTTPGVTNTWVNLFNDQLSATTPVLVIPTGAPLTVTIVYDVETYDEQLSADKLSDMRTSGRTIENRISATVTTDGTTPIVMEAGRRYTVNLTLGMTSVKTTASVDDWGANTDGGAGLPTNIDGDTEIPVTGSNSVQGWTNCDNEENITETIGW